ncbi:DUF6233 domain-containing protein [Streptomyces sp. NBC_00441]|uniref:DUF6233 domain-containing protein n=1 Tax=Streptomyces sp. NBC_00441 TaxID=2975742 RepID=UPI002E2BDA4B|nr:DUF6233 domain-containing protein [Streptomyces sp. NBC_00441]
MNDLPPDLPRLRTLETWLAMTLDRVRAQIAAVETLGAAKRYGDEHRPPAPDWTVELGIGVGAPPAEVHVGGCYATGKRRRVIDRDQARQLLADGIRACAHCRPDSELGVLE